MVSSGISLADARGSEALILSRDREGVVVKSDMNVLVTGASGGLGGAVCQAFLDAGAHVIGAALSWPEPAPFQTLSADLGTAAGCDAMVAEALKHGPIDALVHLV